MAFRLIVGLSGLTTVWQVSAAGIPSRPFKTFLDPSVEARASTLADTSILEDAYNALVVLQNDYFDTSSGKWPSSIDWTGAVTETVVSAMLTTLIKSVGIVGDDGWSANDTLVSTYFQQVVESYSGQDATALMGEAYDDMQWVTLGWVEALNFVRTHMDLNYPDYGDDITAEFAQRASQFWNLASKGWDTTLCHGGMLWNPALAPYKNAITNELYVASSIAMYEYYPGDNPTEPWVPTHDPAHLTAATDAYTWLMGVNMTNTQGLFVDGYHIDSSIPNNVECDQRDEMVYTYNQGVLLSGQRGLYTVTGDASYLDGGHTLIQSAIAATGWDLSTGAPTPTSRRRQSDDLAPWQGLGRSGVMEDECDASGTCSQDAQTFKGIFFHHLAAFCVPVDPIPAAASADKRAYNGVRAAHDAACDTYVGWVEYNAQAAMSTQVDGKFGGWWGANIANDVVVSESHDGINHSAPDKTDYRNKGTPENKTWGTKEKWQPGRDRRRDVQDAGIRGVKRQDTDPNDRGRGRTVETQVGGLAVLRAYWEMSQPAAT